MSFQTKFNDRELLIQAGHQPSLRRSTSFWKNPFSTNPHPQSHSLEKTMDLREGLSKGHDQ